MQLALEGRLTDHHCWLLRVLVEQGECLEAQLTKVDAQIQVHVQEYQEALTLCTTIPGIEEVAAANLLAEIGMNMEQFPSAQHLVSWAGICPGNHESAGQRLSGKPHKGNTWLRRSLCQAAWAASHTKATYLSARFRRLAARKGKKRAIVAVAHSILIILYHVLKTKRPYRELGADYLDRINAVPLKRYFVKRLENLGLQVSVQDIEKADPLPT